MPKFKLNHIALIVSDRERSARFYEQWFGLENRVHEDDHILILSDATGGLLALSQGSAHIPIPRTNHFGFQVESTDQIIEMREQARAAGIEEAEWQEHGPTRLQLFDPDGYRVEVYAF